MGLTHSKPKKPKPPKKLKPATSFFESQKREEEQKELEKKKQEAMLAKDRRPPAKKLKGKPVSADSLGKGTPTVPARPASQEPAQSYDQEAIDRMRNQLRGDASAFLLNNIMLSVQFFENYEKWVILWYSY